MLSFLISIFFLNVSFSEPYNDKTTMQLCEFFLFCFFHTIGWDLNLTWPP